MNHLKIVKPIGRICRHCQVSRQEDAGIGKSDWLRMGAMSQWSRLKEQAAGKWQMPLFVLSMVMLGVSLLRLLPGADRLPPEQAVTYLDTLIRAGIFD